MRLIQPAKGSRYDLTCTTCPPPNSWCCSCLLLQFLPPALDGSHHISFADIMFPSQPSPVASVAAGTGRCALANNCAVLKAEAKKRSWKPLGTRRGRCRLLIHQLLHLDCKTSTPPPSPGGPGGHETPLEDCLSWRQPDRLTLDRCRSSIQGTDISRCDVHTWNNDAKMRYVTVCMQQVCIV